MPVTAALSRKLYDTLGEDVVTELVEWFNLVDATYRTELRELNEVNFSRFDARMETRLAQNELKWDRRLDEINARFDRAESQMRLEIANVRADILKWMFLFWATTALGVIGLIKF